MLLVYLFSFNLMNLKYLSKEKRILVVDSGLITRWLVKNPIFTVCLSFPWSAVLWPPKLPFNPGKQQEVTVEFTYDSLIMYSRFGGNNTEGMSLIYIYLIVEKAYHNLAGKIQMTRHAKTHIVHEGITCPLTKNNLSEKAQEWY